MIGQTVRHDLEGDLIQITKGQSSYYGKQLPLDTAWYMDFPQDLADFLDILVVKVKQDLTKNELVIHYTASVKLLDQQQLRDMLYLDVPLSAWRFARLAVDLCKWLEQFHTNEIPQLIIHPGRIALLKNEFVLLPTLAGVLPPFPQLFSKDDTGWLNYIAPEVLRTRGNDFNMLFSGDVYALGKTLQMLAIPNRDVPKVTDPYTLAEELIENPSFPEPSGYYPEGFEELAPIIAQMCAFLPEERLSPSDALASFHLVMKKLDIQEKVPRLIAGRKFNQARAYLKDALASQQHSVFYCSHATIHLLYAEIALASSPPSHAKAIAQLKKAQGYEPKNIAIHTKIATTYLAFTKHPQHLLFAEQAYYTAVLLSSWLDDGLIQAWLEVLWQLSPETVLEKTRQIPWSKRQASVFAHRAASFETLGRHTQAWNECADYFKEFGYDEKVFETAKTAADSIAPASLMEWIHHHQGTEGIDPSLSIAWARNRNFEFAQDYLVKAMIAKAKEQKRETD